MDRWPTHQPDPGWSCLDHQLVETELLTRAKIDDVGPIETRLSQLRARLSTFKEQAVSMLSASIARQKDDFLARLLGQITNIEIASPGEIATALLPRNVWSRDTTALSHGTTLAPHQALEAIPRSAELTLAGLEALERATRLSADHLRRIAPMDRAKDATKNVVIGHGQSPPWRDLKDFIKDRLRLPYDEFNRVPVAGIPNTIRLAQMLDNAAIALIVLTGEDEQADGTVRARQNAIHEAGLFQGRLGFARGIVLLEEGCEEFSNIVGLGQIRFPKGNIAAVFEEIRRVLEREGILPA
jgi:hypothetical protein